MRFLFDEMLKKPARLCRIFGIYSEYFKGKTDSELLEYARAKGLIFVTRDEELAKRCIKDAVPCVFVKSNDVEEQIKQVLYETGAKTSFPAETRCPGCNGELEDVKEKEVRNEVPEKVRSEKFWRCKNCRKIYWAGSHWKNIKKLFLRLGI
ncbi:Mut7-C RNAse domain-containing protein [Candidatus Micrarchaeota archaeon]|nr:Mut7-C RNAse domain-containing protein [Candidatus Micrarchaeota archaeon]